jgi:uncharacterized protein (DUF58 family)
MLANVGIEPGTRLPRRKNFRASIGMLSIGAAAAIYSATGREGAAIAAVLALAIDVWVAIRFVPRMAEGMEWKWPRIFSRRRVTREGWIYLAAVVVAVWVAAMTQNDFLYMVLSALLGMFVISGLLSFQNLARLRIGLRVPAQCFAGEAVPVSTHIYNEKRVLSSFALQLTASGGDVRLPAFRFSNVAAREKATQTQEMVLPRRGRYVIRNVQAASSYPFGIVSESRTFALVAECTCYPQIVPVERLSDIVRECESSAAQVERGEGSDLYAIREYVPSEGLRRIDWKASAKTGALKSRQYKAERAPRIALLFDRFGQAADGETFERLVSHAASLAYHLTRSGVEVALVSDDWQTSYAASEAQLESILEYLAVVTMSATAESPVRWSADEGLTLSLRA